MKYLFLLFACATVSSQSLPPGIPDLAAPLPDFARQNDVSVAPATREGNAAFGITFGMEAQWPNLYFEAAEAWDWREFAGITLGLFNPEETPVTVSLRVDNKGANGMEHCNTKQRLVPPNGAETLTLYFNTEDRVRFWGMRGIPVRGPMGTGAPLDLSRITGWQLFLNGTSASHTVLLTSVALIGEGGDLSEKVPFPFIDAYGQYKHQEWPGKIHSDEELRQAYRDERAARPTASRASLDAFGGWRDGPQREGTGWFRTEKVNGAWWLISPEGHLFFSAGVDCVGTWSQTFVDGRQDWFEWLPDEKDSQFQGAYGYAKDVHSMAETINGSGKTFDFYMANLMRAHGGAWQTTWRANTLERLKVWGFNTIGNWSQWDVLQDGDLPFVANLGISGVRPIEAATGYWARMMDVYDPSFAEAVARTADEGTRRWRDNNRCIGYFVDNELAWEGVVQGVLNSGSEQPARRAFLAFLQGHHADISALNTAWGADFPNWDAVADPGPRSGAASADLEAFLEEFAGTYYRTIAEGLARFAPNQLYLGCRFASAPEPVVRACARYASVVSFNIYARELSARDSALFSSLDKPVLIGEFHFGATDRGMFHPGLVPVADQAARGAAYVHYVESMLRHPAVVGCHWFQYVDEATTGRCYDGENYNIGFVDITDQPYPELAGAATALHGRMYRVRQELPSP